MPGPPAVVRAGSPLPSGMTTRRTRLGTAGEDHVRRHLERTGWILVETNWRCPVGEIDLVFLDGEELVLVEVKTRRGDAAGSAVEAVSRTKAAKLIKAAEWYVGAHPEHRDRIWRIDVAALQLSTFGAVERLTMVENAIVAG